LLVGDRCVTADRDCSVIRKKTLGVLRVLRGCSSSARSPLKLFHLTVPKL